MGGMRNAYKILVRKPEGKIALRRPLDVGGRITLKWILGKLRIRSSDRPL
jgi:hypothetical protein